MNIEAMQTLKDWLEKGAPHIILNMAEAQRPYYPGGYAASINGNGECGTTCCIAGYAAFIHDGFKAVHANDPPGDIWDAVVDKAMRALDLPKDTAETKWMRHDLFDPNLAPEDCTPQQAADAVQRVMDGKHPWPLRDTA